MSLNKWVVLIAHAFVGWALCGATMWIGMAVTSERNALIAHAIGAPIYFSLVSLVYFKRFSYTAVLPTALFFTGFVIVVDFTLVALVINRSLEMFASLLGTWIPFALIFASTYLTGSQIINSQRSPAAVS